MTFREAFAALFAWRQPRKSFDTGEPDRDETPLEWLNRISKLGR